VSNISSARLRPTARAKATPGVVQNQPPRPPGTWKRADSAATARSQEATQVGAYTEKTAHPDEVAPVHVAEIVSRGEHGPLGREDDPARLAFLDSAKCLEQLAQVQLGERVALLRAVHRHDDEVVFVCHVDVLVIHFQPPRRRPRPGFARPAS
jgi:hypothetical protein